jgi:hypothetical protein
MNKEYIEREAAVDIINRVKHNFAPSARTVLDAAISCINTYVPSADVAPVIYGKWEEYKVPNIICCSECDWGTGVEERRQFKYCPNCGAKM